MGIWAPTIQCIEEQFPFLARLRVCYGDPDLASPLPDFLKIVVAATNGLIQETSSTRGLAMLVPRTYETALWTACGVALQAIRHQFSSLSASVPHFEKGQLLLLDGKWVVAFEAHRGGMLRLKMAGENWKEIPERQWLRLQPVNTKRQLSAPRGFIRAPSDPLDLLLGTETCGNRTVFTNRVILVTGVGVAGEMLRDAVLLPETTPGHTEEAIDLLRLVNCGVLRTDGDWVSLSPGQLDAEPVLLLAPGLLAVREHLRHPRVQPPVLILDGGESFSTRLDVLDEVLDVAGPALALVERHDADATWPLAKRSFATWCWTPEEARDLDRTGERRIASAEKPAFYPLCQSLRDFSNHRITRLLCEDTDLDDAWQILRRLLCGFDQSLPELKEVEGSLYACLLGLARQVRLPAPEGDDCDDFESRIDGLRQLVVRHAYCIDDATLYEAQYLIECLDGIRARFTTERSAKAARLKAVLYSSHARTIAVVLPNLAEAEITEKSWRPRLSDELAERVHFCCPATISESMRFQQAVFTGWLGEAKMRRLLDGCLAPQADVLLYPFEAVWLGSATHRWNRSTRSTVSSRDRARLLRLDTSVVPPVPEHHDEPVHEDQRDVEDVQELELKLRTFHRCHAAGTAQPGEEQLEARLVSFADGYFTFLTESHAVPVIEDLIAGGALEPGRVESKRTSELQTGDFVVFREGSSGNVIRDIADAALARAGKRTRREVAGLWRKALREFVDCSEDDFWDFRRRERIRDAVRKLQAAGLERHEATIRGWLVDEYRIIGPRSPDRDIAIIATVTNNGELKARHREVCQAIHDVWGAHLSAATFLIQQLLAHLPKHLDGKGVTSSVSVDIPGLGCARVVRIEEIDRVATTIPANRANWLMKDSD